MIKTIWKHRVAIALVVLGMICFLIAARAQTFRAFAVVFMIGLLLMARPFKQVLTDNLGKLIRQIKKSYLGVFSVLLLVTGCTSAPTYLSDMHKVSAGSKVEYFAESAPNHLGRRSRKRIASIEKLQRGFTHREIREWGEKARNQKAPAWTVRTVIETNGRRSGILYPAR